MLGSNAWYAPLRAVQSKGSTAQRPGSLAGLAAARRVHEGQFFTPDAVAELMWRLLAPAMEVWRDKRRIAVLDNSLGSGRLLQFADPERHSLHGLDVDAEAVSAFAQVATTAGFQVEVEVGGMEMAKLSKFDCAFINPPFSLHLESPYLWPYPCTTFGKFGPSTSTLSHAYALAQAVDAAQLVVALLPASFAAEVAACPAQYLDDANATRLAAHIELPRGLFRDEGTDVAVALLVFDATPVANPQRIALPALDAPLPDLGLELHRAQGAPKLRIHGIDDDGPSITLPVTGDPSVRIIRAGRRLIMQFACGLTEARVANAVLREQVPAKDDEGSRHRYPHGVDYTGQGALDIEILLAQEDPLAAFSGLLLTIRKAGGKPQFAPGVQEYFARRVRRLARDKAPFAHTVFVKSGRADCSANEFIARARRDQVANPKVWGSPTIKAGDEVRFVRAEGGASFTLGGKSYTITETALIERFEVIEGAAQTGWRDIHPGLLATYPDLAHELDMRAKAAGLDAWLSWGYQYADAIELLLKRSAVAAWDMGLGKARLAAGLSILSGCTHALVTVEAGLLSEMETELTGLPIDPASWQIIRTPDQARNLRRINVISYERLRLPVFGGARTRAWRWRVRDTYAGLLRRGCGIVISDEGDLLANPESQQSQCLRHLAARRRFVLSGTPLANYPRDILPILSYAVGDGTAAQPYGWRGGYLEPRLLTSMAYAARGVDAFRERHVCLEWVTAEFKDGMTSGAKREVPRINNLQGYRDLLAPHVKRRVTAEPEVAKCFTLPVPSEIETVLPWDEWHLSHYVTVADQFVAWYLDMRKKMGVRNSNLIALLARIQAVSIAQDWPQHGHEKFGGTANLTSKQRYALDRIEELADQGHKVILYAENPGQLELLGRHLTDRKVDNVLFHGGIPPAQRVKALNEGFRFGPAPALLASLGVTAKGLNLYQSDYVLLLSRSWSATVENQAIHRVLRPQQKRAVTVERVHLEGGLDIYKDQMVRMKADSAAAGLDWAEPETDDVEFLHLDTVLTRFIEDLAALRGITGHQLRQQLAA